MLAVLPISAAETVPLRHAVLRAGMPREAAIFPDDDRAVHFGAWQGGELLAVASVQCETLPGDTRNAWRLRGMATAPHAQGQGVGGELLKGCMNYVRQRGAEILWCNARSGAVNFYARHGFVAVGAEFEIPTAGPHFVMLRGLEALG